MLAADDAQHQADVLRRPARVRHRRFERGIVGVIFGQVAVGVRDLDSGRQFMPLVPGADEKTLGFGLVPQHAGDRRPRRLRVDDQPSIAHHQVDDLIGGHTRVTRAAERERDRVSHGQLLGLLLHKRSRGRRRSHLHGFQRNLLRLHRLGHLYPRLLTLHGRRHGEFLISLENLGLLRLHHRLDGLLSALLLRLGECAQCRLGVGIRLTFPHEPLFREIDPFLIPVVVRHVVGFVVWVEPRDGTAVKLCILRPVHQHPATYDLHEDFAPGVEFASLSVERFADLSSDEGARVVSERVLARDAALFCLRFDRDRVR